MVCYESTKRIFSKLVFEWFSLIHQNSSPYRILIKMLSKGGIAKLGKMKGSRSKILLFATRWSIFPLFVGCHQNFGNCSVSLSGKIIIYVYPSIPVVTGASDFGFSAKSPFVLQTGDTEDILLLGSPRRYLGEPGPWILGCHPKVTLFYKQGTCTLSTLTRVHTGTRFVNNLVNGNRFYHAVVIHILIGWLLGETKTQQRLRARWRSLMLVHLSPSCINIVGAGYWRCCMLFYLMILYHSFFPLGRETKHNLL